MSSRENNLQVAFTSHEMISLFVSSFR
jgi:hypothetical protein